MAEEHDRTHRLLFSFPRLIEDLIRQCLGGEWVERLDFSTLEKVPERLVSRELARREQDVLWRLLYLPPESAEPDWFYVYLHLEHLSSQPRLTALDMVVYDMVAYQDLARRGGLTRDAGLTPILSVVSKRTALTEKEAAARCSRGNVGRRPPLRGRSTTYLIS